MEEAIIKIKYAPNTLFIVGKMGEAELKIVNSKGSLKNKYGILNGITEHCEKCKERILSILN